ncbi:MAG: rhodanese-like domain-containing protein [Vicingaceae bacterium]
MEHIDAKTFKEKINSDSEGVIIDVRTPEEEIEGTIENSININIMDADFPEKIKNIEKGKNYYIFCRSGGRSASACEFMEENGYSNTYNLIGGINAWNNLK